MIGSTYKDEQQERRHTLPLLAKSAGMAGDILVPEETIFGIVSRYHILSGHSSSVDTLLELLSRRGICISSSLPSSLHLIFQHLPLPLQTAEELAERHTPLPYFRAFANPVHYAAIAQSVTMGRACNSKITLGLLASRIGAEDVLRFCPECAKYDREVTGVATWYRVHQLPGVLLCPYHRAPLFENRCLVRRLKRQQLFLPDSTKEDWSKEYNISVIDKRAYEKLFRVALLSAQLFQHRPEPAKANTWRNQYLAHFSERGLLTPALRIRQLQLQSEFVDFWSDLKSLTPFAELLDRCKRDDSWLANLYRRSRSAHHPLMHVLLIGLLADNINSFFIPGEETSKVNIAPCAPRAPEQEHNIASLLAAGLSVRQISKEVGLSINSVLTKAEKIGTVIKRRPKKLNAGVREQVRLALAGGQAIPDIVEATRLSPSTINRILGGDKALQTQRTIALRQQRQTGQKQSVSYNRKFTEIRF
nr:TnsD family Tn7-like transposition protein [Massilia putida]